jgi:hypothetical protein
MRNFYRLGSVVALGLAYSASQADQAQIKLSFFPSVCVADQRSTVDVNAEIRDSTGKAVPAGTQVLFTTTLGSFRSSVVSVTQGGLAHAILIAGGVAGLATVTVSPLGLDANPTVETFEFVATRAELSSAREYVVVTAPSYMQYANDTRIIVAAAKNRGVVLRYREIEIHADELEYDIQGYTVKARNAHLKLGKLSQDFEQLNLTLNARSGYGTTTFKSSTPDLIGIAAGIPVFLNQEKDHLVISPPTDRFGLVEINRENLSLAPGMVSDQEFEIDDVSRSPSTISARRATILPRKGIQFQNAAIYVANAKIIKLPLFKLDFATSTSPLITDGIVSMNDNQLGINYPQYLILQPGLTSDLRFHMGDSYGRDYGSDRGAFLDYELNWNKGDDFNGGFTFGGIGRNDWDLSAQQYWRIDPLTTVNGQVDLPTGQGFFASGGLTHQFLGFNTNLSANHSQTFTGITSTSQSYGANLLSDSRRVLNLPLKYSYGLVTTETQSDDSVLGAREQNGSGLSAQFQSDALPLDKKSTLTTSWQISKLYGEDVSRTLTVLGAANISRKISKTTSLLLTYNFTQDNFNDIALGRHMFTLQTSYHAGKIQANLLTSKSLGVNRTNIYGDVSYSVSKLWRLSYNYTSQVYDDDKFLDYNIGIGYRIGWREVGILWSESTHRFGLQLLGAQF